MSRSIQKLAVVSINRNKYSETFIQNAFDAFPVEKFLLYGDYLPNLASTDWRNEGEAILGKNWLGKAKQQSEEAHLKDWLKAKKIEAVLANYGPSGVALAKICAQLQIPLFVHFHGYDAYRADILQQYGPAYPQMFQSAKGIVVVSEDMKGQLLALGAPEAKLQLLHYGVDTRFFQAGNLKADLEFLFVGRLVPKKSPLTAIRAFQQVLAEYPAARLRILGDGELMEACLGYVQNAGLAQNVLFEGAASPEQVRAAMEGCRALILPSVKTDLGDSEGTPLVMLEAGACGRAVIASRHGGIVDVIQDGENGLLVSEGDTAGLAQAMLRLAASKDLAYELGQNAREVIQSKFQQTSYHRRLWDWMNAQVQGS